MQSATLCYLLRPEREEVLLIRKKRGLGEGKFVGPGGKVEDGETPRECVVREVEEEIRVMPRDPEKVGEFRFVFGEEPRMFVHVFRTEEFAGEPESTPEADPAWFDYESVPYDEMWEDDRHWLPHLLDGETFAGEFVFDSDGDELREWTVETGVRELEATAER
ncbi:8-oxo-dGTP diphosphatase [Halorussus gelatinilyticus]|uniref:Oxidized purine nucleoside triphosphate hydrolase n=1 Tax=Halorussus gelatinilyticus TaxID=2937524 RepID=A0A8U0IDK7_9EURY|nr:8-oxo-dGTP diphosphatase [Halorussus gelatinilyticus]UPV99139.1 8-oxo-dGTP diphosphatase [Halorussus gelatinilyticus]